MGGHRPPLQGEGQPVPMAFARITQSWALALSSNGQALFRNRFAPTWIVLSSSCRHLKWTLESDGAVLPRPDPQVQQCGSASICLHGELQRCQPGAGKQGAGKLSVVGFSRFRRNSRHRPHCFPSDSAAEAVCGLPAPERVMPDSLTSHSCSSAQILTYSH